MAAIKLLIIFGILLLFAFPLIPLSIKVRKVATYSALKYPAPHNKKNIVFVILSVLFFLLLVLIAAVVGFMETLGDKIASIPFVANLLSGISSQVEYVARTVVCVVLINLIVLYVFMIVKLLTKTVIFDKMFKLSKPKKNKKKGKDGEEGDEDEVEETDEVAEAEEAAKDEEKDDDEEPPVFDHSSDKKKADEDDDDLLTKLVRKSEGEDVSLMKNNAFMRLFFEGENFEYARPWLHRAVSVLQLFVYLTELLYLGVIFLFLMGVFFPGPAWLYTIVNFVTNKLYIYPFVSLIFLQEICNTMSCPIYDKKRRKTKREEEEEKKEKKRDARLAELRAILLRRFGKEHCIRFFPATVTDASVEYEVTNKTYAGALDYIKGEMKRSSGRVVQRYMEGLDALFNNKHISFSASFYSELGEYLVAYTYIRLLAGERQLFIVSDKNKVESLKKFIGKRLTDLTGCPEQHTWRVHGYEDQRLDQADVLVACPDDFRVDDIVEHYPGFFQECCNAIFVDADRVLSLDSYLCPIMALRLHKVTEGRIRFVFLSRDILQGFGNCLKKFFCLDKVIDYSNLEENEKVNYYLWNRESRRTYRGKEQRLTSVEGIIAEEAINHHVDGVRILTETPLDHAEKSSLLDRNVEINDFYKKVPEVNFLICTDDRYNLSSAVYSFTRFRGKKHSVLHVLSKPYLLREYFMSHIEEYVNRSSFIQPRAIEHAHPKKLSLLRLFCDATGGEGIEISEFVSRMKEILGTATAGAQAAICPFCYELDKRFDLEIKRIQRERDKKLGKTTEEENDTHSQFDSLSVDDYAAYLVAGLCDSTTTPLEHSEGKRARDYYIFAIPDRRRSDYRIEQESLIRFTRIKEVFQKVLSCNDRVALFFNDKIIGVIDTFPSRVYQQYLPGQSIIYNNTEYEIERISDDCRVIYLRQENVASRNTLESVPLRRYLISEQKAMGNDGIVTFTKGPIESITLKREDISMVGETYGYYSLVTDRQVIDFEKSMHGNLNMPQHIIEQQRRNIDKMNGRMMSMTIKARPIEETDENGNPLPPCTDGMRMLMAAVFSEFIRTMFPDAYRCIAVCPVLETPLRYELGSDIVSFEDHVRTLYPFLKEGSVVKTEENEVKILFVNDCHDDVGVLDLLFDYSAKFMQQFLTNIYGYLYWLKTNPELVSGQKHYIYFGRDELSDVYDLEGCCRLLKDCNQTFSDSGKNDVDVVSLSEDAKNRNQKKKYCAFCHSALERGRYFYFDRNRYICMNCQTTAVASNKTLDKLYGDVKRYLAETYPDVNIPQDVKAILDKVYDLPGEKVFSEYYYRLDPNNRAIFVERDDPELNTKVSLLRGLVGFWQLDNSLDIPSSMGQLYYEELLYLRSIHEDAIADWVEQNLDPAILAIVEEIREFVKGIDKPDPKPEEGDDASEADEKDAEEQGEEKDAEGESDKAETPDGKSRTSFDFLMERRKDSKDDSYDDIPVDEDDDGDQSLYDPNQVPRFWKRYLRDEHASGTAEEPSGSSDGGSEVAENFDEEGETPEGEAEGEEKGKKAKKDKKKGKKEVKPEDNAGKRRKFACGISYYIYEQDEATNKRIAFYNQVVRQAADFDDKTPIPLNGLSPEEGARIATLVGCDFPEMFWLDGRYRYNDTHYWICFRCLGPAGDFDKDQALRKIKELRSAAKKFTRGISKRTPPYKALVKIYRRLILTLDYDSLGLRAGVDRDRRSDDVLRSLHSALVKHKVVCAGYAVALQYLLQMVGLPAGYVISNYVGNEGHAFTVVKLDTECYYIDATWGDASNTQTGTKNKDLVKYDYLCVPLREFKMTSADQVVFHTPNDELYPNLEEFKATRFEYYRRRGFYFDRYDREKLKMALLKTIREYDRAEMGDFTFSIRCSDVNTAKYLLSRLGDNRELSAMISELTPQLKKKELALVSGNPRWYVPGQTPVLTFIFS